VTGATEAELARAAPGAFQVDAFQSLDAAKTAVLHRNVYGAFQPVPSPVVLIASAASPAVAVLLQRTFASVPSRSSRALAIQDLVPLPPSDSSGATAFSAILSLIICGLTGTAMVYALTRHRPEEFRLAATLALAVGAGLITALVINVLVAAFPNHFFAVWGVATLFALAIGMSIAAFQVIFGIAGTAIGAILFLVIGSPASGGSSAPDLLPDFWRTLSQVLPPDNQPARSAGLLLDGRDPASAPRPFTKHGMSPEPEPTSKHPDAHLWRIAGRAAHPGRRPAIVLARAWSPSGFRDRVCPLAAAAHGVVDVKIVALPRATSGSRVDTAVAATMQKHGRSCQMSSPARAAHTQKAVRWRDAGAAPFGLNLSSRLAVRARCCSTGVGSSGLEAAPTSGWSRSTPSGASPATRGMLRVDEGGSRVGLKAGFLSMGQVEWWSRLMGRKCSSPDAAMVTHCRPRLRVRAAVSVARVYSLRARGLSSFRGSS
jgi:hypothetical protein